MSFGAPLGLLALLGLPLLVSLYFLRRRSPPRTVSAVFLWRATEELAQTGRRWNQLNRRLSLLLECLAVLALAAFLADARWGPSSGPQAHTVIVLDGSLSMQARLADRQTVYRRAVEEATRRLNAAGGVATIITTGPAPHLLAGPAVAASLAIGKLEGWTPGEPSHAFEPAWTLARELAGTEGTIVFLTDGLPASTPPAIEAVALGSPLANIGIVSASRDDGSDGTAVTLRVANFSTKAWSGAIRVNAGKPLDVQASIAAGETKEIIAHLPPSEDVTTSLPDDSMAWDNTVVLGPDPPRVVHVRTELSDKTIDRFLASAPFVTTDGEPDLTLRAADLKTSSDWSLTIGVKPEKAETRGYLGPFVAEKNHPLLEDVLFNGVIWAAGPSPKGRAILSAGSVALMTEEPGHRFHMNIDLARSNIARTPAWPVLLANLIDLRRAAAPGFGRRNAMAGESVRVVTGPGEWKVRGPSIDRTLGPLEQTFSAPAGTYTLEHDRKVIDRLWVNALDAAESDLRSKGPGKRDASVRLATGALLPIDRSGVPLALAIALLLADYAFAAPGRRRLRPEAARA